MEDWENKKQTNFLNKYINMAAYITKEGLRQTLLNYTNSLKNWLPLKKTDQSVVIEAPKEAPETFKNALEIKSDGMIYVIGTNNDSIQLQSRLDKIGTIMTETPEEALTYLSQEYLGSLLYIKNGNQSYISGLYTIGINASASGSLMLVKIGTTTSSAEDLGTRVDALEDFVDKPLEFSEIDELIKDDEYIIK